MDRRRSSSHLSSRLILRVYSAENLRHVSSQGTYCKIYVDETEMTRGSHSMGGGGARSSLKRFLNQSSSDTSRHHNATSGTSNGDSLDHFSPRIYKTKAQKALRGDPVWKEIFEIPVFNVQNEVLTIRIKTARLMSAPAIGIGSIALREISPDSTWDKWINLLDNSKRPAGKLRIQMRLLPPGYVPSPRAEDDDVVSGDEKFMPRRTNSSNSSPLPRSMRRSAIIAPPIGGVGIIRRSSALSRSLVESRTSSSTTASDSISSDYSNDRGSVPSVSPYPQNDSIGSPESPSPPFIRPSQSPVLRDSRQSAASSVARDTTLSMSSRATEELDMLANKYMTRSQARTSHRAPSQILRPTMPSVAERKISTTKELSIPELPPTEESPESPEGPASPVPSSSPQKITLSTSTGPAGKDLKDDRSPRTTNTTTGSSDEDEPQDATVEFDFDTGEVRSSTRLPAHMMRSSSVAKYRAELEEFSESSEEDEPEDDEMNPDEDPEGPRMVLRRTVMNVLGRSSVNVIMDEEEEDEDDELDYDEDAFVFDELPILDMSDSMVLLKDVDFADFGLPAPSS